MDDALHRTWRHSELKGNGFVVNLFARLAGNLPAVELGASMPFGDSLNGFSKDMGALKTFEASCLEDNGAFGAITPRIVKPACIVVVESRLLVGPSRTTGSAERGCSHVSNSACGGTRSSE